jgi:DNA-binding SARP family transcriptional activator/tetratricopeptide (TPR) repeat protein
MALPRVLGASFLPEVVMAAGMAFCLLGPLTVRDGEVRVPIPPGKQRVLLAALLLQAGRTVSTDELAGLLWGPARPPSAAATVHNYVKRLRQALGASRDRIMTQPGGYLIRVNPGELDVMAMEEALASAHQAARRAAWADADTQASAALALWRGEPLCDIDSGVLPAQEVPRLAELRFQARELHIEASLHLGGHAAVLAQARGLAAEAPLREHTHALLIRALHECGRRAEALQAYQNARRVLVEELGCEPGPELQVLHREILADSPGTPWSETRRLRDRIDGGDRQDVTAAGLDAAEPGRLSSATVRQLPLAVPRFVGRAAELRELDGLPDAALQGPVVAVIDGTAGAGKTTLAVHWAHLAAGSFPDGQVYLNLNGFGPAGGPLAPMEALGTLLEALQVPVARMPVSLAGRIGLWRSELAGRRLLIVLDNARDEDQVRPLLPGSADCVVLVTSRSRLTGLVALEGARPLTLGVLSQSEARQLVAARLGAGCVAADPVATDRLIDACARLPLALAIASALISTRPPGSLETVSRELAGTGGALDALDAGDAPASLRAVFAWSYQALTPPAARLFCLLAEHRGPDISVAAAASLAGIPASEAAAALAQLARANLVSGQHHGRFGFHDLLRQFAAAQLSELHADGERRAAGDRMLDHYTRTATGAAMAITPERTLQVAGQPVQGVVPERIERQDEAFAWLRAEHAVLMRAIGYAADNGADEHAWQLALALTDFHDRAGYWHDWAACQRTALTAAEQLEDIEAQSSAHRYLGRASFLIGQHDEALYHLTRSVQLRQEIGQPAAEAGIHIDICRLHEHRGEVDRALRSAGQALKLYRAAGHRVGEAHALNAVGFYYALAGRHDDARRLCSQALKIATETMNRRAEAQAWQSLGLIHQQTGDPGQAIACYQRALTLHRELADRYFTTKLLTHLGDAHQAAGDVDAARHAWEEALTILDDLGHADADQVRAKLRRPDDSRRRMR